MNDTREREREVAKPQVYATRNGSYSDPEEPEDDFKEKIITPTVRTYQRGKSKRRNPPSYKDVVSDEESEEDYSDDDDKSLGKRSFSSEEDSVTDETETESETESEESDYSDDRSSRRNRGAKAKPLKSSKNRHRRKPRKASSRDSRNSDHTHSSRDNLSRHSRDNLSRHPQPPHPAVPYGYPPAAAGYPPGQFVPVMPGGAPQFQPVQILPYPAHNPAPPRQDEPPRPDIQPTDPPVYSYLVRRGYTPKEPKTSGSAGSVSGSQRSGADRLEEPDQRLSSGVEYMRR